MDIAHKVFIVTGGASGLGAGTAKMLTQQGARVVLADVQDEAGQALAASLPGNTTVVAGSLAAVTIGKAA